MGSLLLQGMGGGGSGAGNQGVTLSGDSSITTGGGDISFTGSSASAGIEGFFLSGSVSTATNGGNIMLSADILGPVLVTAKAGNTVTIKPKTTGWPVNWGSNSTATVLELTDERLDAINANNLVIGDSATGPITVTADISRAAATNMKLVSGADISFTTGAINTAGGTLTLDSGPPAAGAVKPGKSGTDATASTVTLASGGVLFLDISGSTVDTGYQQLKVTGAVDLTGTTLKLSGDYTPAGTDSFTLVDNDSSDPITGTFADLAEGADLTFDSVPMVISYTGGDGNDVVLSRVNQAPAISDVADTSTNEDTATAPAISFTVGDDITAPGSLAVTADSSNTGLVPVANIVLDDSGASRTATITPAANQSGTTTITLTVTDASGLTASDTFELTVNAVNDIPAFTGGADQTILAGEAAARTVPGWATGISDGDAGADQELSFQVTVLEGAALFSSPPAVSADGTLAYTPVGTSGTARVSVTLTDDAGIGGTPALTTAAQVFSISVNRAPVPKADTLGTVRNTPAMVIARKFALNDRDPDGDAISITAVSAASARAGSVTLILGTLTYIPPSDFAGEDSFTYTLTDARGATAEGAVKVTVADEGAISRNSSIQETADGFALRFAGIPGYRYTIEYSSELTGGWTTLIGPVTADEQGVIEYTDNPQPRPARRFYRTISAP